MTVNSLILALLEKVSTEQYLQPASSSFISLLYSELCRQDLVQNTYCSHCFTTVPTRCDKCSHNNAEPQPTNTRVIQIQEYCCHNLSQLIKTANLVMSHKNDLKAIFQSLGKLRLPIRDHNWKLLNWSESQAAVWEKEQWAKKFNSPKQMPLQCETGWDTGWGSSKWLIPQLQIYLFTWFL